MQNILVTGGAGFIGSNFIVHLLESGAEVRLVNLDALTYAGNLANLAPVSNDRRYRFVQGSICDGSLVKGILEEEQIDTLVHFAAESHVDRSILDPGIFVQTNIVGTQVLLDSAREYWGRDAEAKGCRFHHISTDEVFGSLNPGDPAFSEKTPYSPNSPYAASKASSDHLVRAYHHTYGMPVTITNCSNNYGPRQFPEKFIPLMILNALEGKTLPVYGDGMQIRDWLYVEDHCRAIRLVLEKGSSGETYNIGGNNQPTNLEILEQLCSLLDEMVPDSPFRPHRQLMQHVTDRPGHDRRYAINLDKIRKELGWEPSESLATGLRRTIRWYLDNSGWIDIIRSQNNYKNWIQKNYSGRQDEKNASTV